MMNKSYLKCEKCENRSMFEEKNKKTLAMFKEHKNVQLSITTLLVLFTPALINTDILIMCVNRKRDYQPIPLKILGYTLNLLGYVKIMFILYFLSLFKHCIYNLVSFLIGLLQQYKYYIRYSIVNNNFS